MREPEIIGERRSYIVGLDLGQKRDYSAIAILELSRAHIHPP